MIANIVKRYYKKILVYLAAPIIIGLLIILMSYPEGIFKADVLTYVLIYSYTIGIPFMLVSTIIELQLEKRIRWLKKPLKRFVITALLEMTWAFLLILIIHYIFFFRIRGDNMPEIYERTIIAFIYATIFIVLGVMIQNSIFFFKNWKQAAVNEEILKREILLVEFEVLKNQINPHFLFNNLTALTSLLYKDQDKAALFIDQLANVFRYILEFREKEVVDLATEKKLLNTVAFLYRIRYDKSFQLNIYLPEEKNRYVIPMVLQILLENAIKHNKLSPKKPLKVEIKQEGNYINIKNNLQPKTVIQHPNKLGLQNIQSRYKYLSDKKVSIEKTEKYFNVKIPVLNKKP
jgi:two-component system LytT family sensor kinase